MARDRYAAARTHQGYQVPSEREGCRSCSHRSKAAITLLNGAKGYDCTLGHFLVSAGGICRMYQRADIVALPRVRP